MARKLRRVAMAPPFMRPADLDAPLRVKVQKSDKECTNAGIKWE
jgi:hypothetical protein